MTALPLTYDDALVIDCARALVREWGTPGDDRDMRVTIREAALADAVGRLDGRPVAGGAR